MTTTAQRLAKTILSGQSFLQPPADGPIAFGCGVPLLRQVLARGATTYSIADDGYPSNGHMRAFTALPVWTASTVSQSLIVKLARALKRGPSVNYTCTAVCSAKFELAMSRKAKPGTGTPVVIANGNSRLAADGTKRASVRFTTKARRRLRGARLIRVTLRSTFTDSTGKKTVELRKLTIRR